MGIEIFGDQNRGSSNAVSQALLFLFIISVIGGISVAGNDVINTTLDRESVDLNIKTIEGIDKTIMSLDSSMGNNKDSKAIKTYGINTYGSSLTTQENTTITFETPDPANEISLRSNPFVLEGDQHKIIYDTGIMGYETETTNHTVSTPVETQFKNNNQNYLPIITTKYNINQFPRGKQQEMVMLISRNRPPQHETIPSDTTINVTTQNTDMWRSYFETLDYISTVNIKSADTIEAEIQPGEDITIYHYQALLKDSG